MLSKAGLKKAPELEEARIEGVFDKPSENIW
jgi:hypothetical protein